MSDGQLNAMLDPDAVKLAQELDGLPLALATAGAYLDQSAISFSDYLRLYKASWTRLLETSPELSSYEDRTLYSTWQLSFDHVKQRNELSAKLLQLWAYFDNQDIWFELLRHSNSKDPEWIRELTEDELSFNEAVRVLSDHGLVEVDMSSQELIESRGYSIHGCVHSWTIYVLNQEWDYDLAKLALKFVGSHVPGNESAKRWLTQRRLLQHAARCSHAVLNGMVTDDGMEWALYNLGLLYADQDKLDEAEKMYQCALRGEEKALGPDHTSTLDTVTQLGHSLPFPGQAGRGREDVPAGTARIREGIGPRSYINTGYGQQLGHSLLFPGQAGRGREDVPAGTARIREGIGPRSYINTEYGQQLGQPLQIPGQAGRGREDVPAGTARKGEGIGPRSYINTEYGQQLGHSLLFPGQARRGREDVPAGTARKGEGIGPRSHINTEYGQQLGPSLRGPGQAGRGREDVPAGTARKREGIGPRSYINTGYGQQLGRSLQIPGQAGRGREDVPAGTARKGEGIGPRSYINTGYGQQLGQPLHIPRQAGRGREDVPAGTARIREGMGPDHTSTLNTVDTFGLLYKSQGRLDEAEKMYRRALQGYEKALGLENVTRYRPALDTMWNLGDLFAAQGRLDEAKEMYSRARAGFQTLLGPSSNYVNA